MSFAPKLRMIAGPNGSGKTTLYHLLRELRDPINFGHFVNADEIEKGISVNQRVDLGKYAISVDLNKLKEIFRHHPLSQPAFADGFNLQGNILTVAKSAQNGYFSAILADYIRSQLLLTGKTFSFETVMSSDDKIRFLERAKEVGYRTYLYYVCTEDSSINRNRVANRVETGGHDVPNEKIRARYERSLDLLLPAIKATDRAYIFDNSGAEHKFIAEVTNGEEIGLKVASQPLWFRKAVLEKILLPPSILG